MSAHPDVPPPVFRAAVFDMDGLLIDSEPFWWEAEQAVFAEVGVRLTDADCVQTMGLRVDEVVAYWAARRSWQGVPPERVAERVVQRVIEFVRSRGKEMAGAGRALSLCEGLGLRLGLASSSSPEIIDAVLDRLGFAGRFEVVRSAAHEARGKPHPDVYLSACAGLGIPPPDCVAFEDSPNGVRAARAAGMHCIAVPEHNLPGADLIASLANVVLPSLEALAGSHLRATPGGWRDDTAGGPVPADTLLIRPMNL
jgi:beta-phosphoglucomutase-like phosphatase (HAD superfamily)